VTALDLPRRAGAQTVAASLGVAENMLPATAAGEDRKIDASVATVFICFQSHQASLGVL
jgi:hypothetical protein